MGTLWYPTRINDITELLKRQARGLLTETAVNDHEDTRLES